jgi:hypothetical protein
VAGTLRLKHQSLGAAGAGYGAEGGGMSAFAVTAPRVYENTRGAENKTKTERRWMGVPWVGSTFSSLCTTWCLVNNTVKSRIEFVL